MRIENKIINPSFETMRKYANDVDHKTVKFDYIEGSGYLQPEVSPTLTRYIVRKNGRLNKCSLVLAQDTVLQNYAFNTEDDSWLNVLDKFWDKKNKYQFFLAVMERYQYGWGCLEVLLNSDGTVNSLVQFPAYTACIKKRDNRYYAVQRGINIGADKELRLMQYLDDYPEEDKDLPICLWLGGGATHEFYDTPVWYPDVDGILGKINLDMLNAEQLNNGNNMDGVLIFSGPPQRVNPYTNERPEDTLKKQIHNTGTGTMVLYLESTGTEVPMNVNYIPISNNNWNYLESFSADCDKAVMSNYSIPKARLMIDDTTESMNSNKTNTIWEIYTICLNYEQYPNELIIREFNKIFFGIDIDVEMGTPIFSDKEQTKLLNLLATYNAGLTTLGQTLKELKTLKPELDFESVDWDSPIMDERFYNGKLLGLDNTESSDALMDWLNGVELV